jgi:hypothetical protein
MCIASSIFVARPVSAATTDEFSVMTRNLYLGADIAKSMTFCPDLSAVAQDMWTQVAQTDFSRRVEALAADVVAQRPSVLGLQEAMKWVCLDAKGTEVTVVDFTNQLLARLSTDGVPYEIAQSSGDLAVSAGFAIAPIPGSTIVTDPTVLRAALGSDSAACGLQIADVLAVRADLAGDVTAVGSRNFSSTVKLAGLLDVKRGYAWADITVGGHPVHFVTTHLEALWARDAEPAMAAQARELVTDLQAITIPIVAMGDFNADPRDPRPTTPGANPGGQPEITSLCADRACNPYWIMTGAGFTDVGPDATDPANLTWGADGLLAGPDLARLDAALSMGNDLGFTDRLDYVFVRGDLSIVSSSLVGREWPTGIATWECNSAAQLANTQAVATRLGITAPTTGRCFATDHLGIAATLSLPSAASSSSATGWVIAAVIVALIVIGTAIVFLMRRRSATGTRPGL